MRNKLGLGDVLNIMIVSFLGIAMLSLIAGLFLVYPRMERQPSEPWQLLTTIIGIFGGALGAAFGFYANRRNFLPPTDQPMETSIQGTFHAETGELADEDRPSSTS